LGLSCSTWGKQSDTFSNHLPFAGVVLAFEYDVFSPIIQALSICMLHLGRDVDTSSQAISHQRSTIFCKRRFLSTPSTDMEQLGLMVLMASFPEAALWSDLNQNSGNEQDRIALTGEAINSALSSRLPRKESVLILCTQFCASSFFPILKKRIQRERIFSVRIKKSS
jgi:hypothetical protein